MSNANNRGMSSTLLLGSILAFALAFRLYGLTGDMHFDPIVYAQCAYNLLQGTFTLKTDSWFPHRLTVFLPVAPLYAAFGVGSLTSRIWPLALSLGQIALVFWVGRMLFDRPIALLAALFAALAPLDVVYAGVLNPDIVMAAFMTAAVAFWLAAWERAAQPASRNALWLLSGVSFALALVTRENSAVLLVFYLGDILRRRNKRAALGWTVLGALLVALPLLAAYAAQTGDPFYRLGVVSGRYGTPAKYEGAHWLFYPALLWHVRHGATGLFPLLFAAGIIGALVKPTRARSILLLWALPILLSLQFGSQNLTHYLPILKRERFLTPLTAPLCLLTASVILQWFRGPRREGNKTRARGAAIAGAILLCVLAVNSWGIVRDQRAEGERNYQAFRSTVALLKSDPRLPVLFDHWRTGYRFSYYFDFREGADFYRGGDDRRRMGSPGSFGGSRLGYLCWYPDPARIPEAFVVLDEEALQMARSGSSLTRTYLTEEIPAYADAPPSSWRLVGSFGTLRVYRTPAASSPSP